jgi:hypothetical protein
MAYQASAFDNPFAFAQTQQHWRIPAQGSLPSKFQSLVTLEPIWGVFCPSSPRFWAAENRHDNPFFSFYLVNPIAFLGAAVLVIVGNRKGWLNPYETLSTAFLLVIPYLTRAHEMSMVSMARFAAAAVPCYLVAGHLLHRIPAAIAISALALAAFLLGAYSAMFAVDYPVF